MSFSLVGTSWNLAGFSSYVANKDLSWASSVTLHHTGSPNLKQRGNGLIVQHIKNIQHYYEKELGWSRGPHLFIDDHDINGMSPLTERGVHAVSFNSKSIGIEVLGNYDSEDPKSGRGLKCWEQAAQATAIILEKLGLEANSSTVKFHRDDPKTSKSCPGDKVGKEWVLSLIKIAMMEGGSSSPVKDDAGNDDLDAIKWQMDSASKELSGKVSDDQLDEVKDRFNNILWRAKKLSKQ